MTSKRYLFILLIFINSYLAISQQAHTSILASRDTILMEESAGIHPMHAVIFDIDKSNKITGWHWENLSGRLLLELEEKYSFTLGKSYRKTIISTNLNDFSVEWEKHITESNNRVTLYDEIFFLELKKHTVRLDPANGKELWRIKRKLYFTLPKEKVGFFYSNRLSSDRMWAINLDTGEKIWEKQQNRRYGWDDVFMYDPQTLLIASEGINLYNIYNGYKQSYRAKTSYNDAADMILKNALVALGSLLTEAIFEEPFPIEIQDKVNTSSNIMSNVCIDENGNLYLASANKIACLSNKGETIWSNKLEKKKTSKSSLFLLNGNALLLNKGHANYNGNSTLLGEPYLASFDMKTGKEWYLAKIFAEKDEAINNFQVIDNTLFLLINHRIQTYDLTDGHFTGEINIDNFFPTIQDVVFIDGGIFVKKEGNISNIMEIDPELVHLITNEGEIISLDKSLAIINTYDRNDSYKVYLQTNGFDFLHHNGTTYILRGKNIVAILPFEANGFITPQNTFYHFGLNEIWKVDLEK